MSQNRSDERDAASSRGPAWTRLEVEAIVADYFDMLEKELAGVVYSKTTHRRNLSRKLFGRSESAVEFKHANISAVLIELGFPYIVGYRPRPHYQDMLRDVVSERLSGSRRLLDLAGASADDLLVAVPEIEDLLHRRIERHVDRAKDPRIAEPTARYGARLPLNYLERESRNAALGRAGEEFVIAYERARLVAQGAERLAARIEHTSVARGDYEGYDILSFETSGKERLIEVKTTKYGRDTPFFATANEVAVSRRCSDRYAVYRVFEFKSNPRFFELEGAIDRTCDLEASTYRAVPL